MFDDAVAEILPAGVGFGVLVVGGGGEDVGGAEVGAELFGDDGPAHEFGDGEEFEKTGFGGDLGIPGVEVDAVEQIGLFVVVGGEEDVVDYPLEDGAELIWVGLDGFGVEDLAVVLADVEVFVFVFGEGDLLLVVTEFEVGDIVWFLYRWFVRRSVLLFLFSLLLLLFQLLR